MPSFDIVSEVDSQQIDNALNQARKELATRLEVGDKREDHGFFCRRVCGRAHLIDYTCARNLSAGAQNAGKRPRRKQVPF